MEEEEYAPYVRYVSFIGFNKHTGEAVIEIDVYDPDWFIESGDKNYLDYLKFRCEVKKKWWWFIYRKVEGAELKAPPVGGGRNVYRVRKNPRYLVVRRFVSNTQKGNIYKILVYPANKQLKEWTKEAGIYFDYITTRKKSKPRANILRLGRVKTKFTTVRKLKKKKTKKKELKVEISVVKPEEEKQPLKSEKKIRMINMCYSWIKKGNQWFGLLGIFKEDAEKWDIKLITKKYDIRKKLMESLSEEFKDTPEVKEQLGELQEYFEKLGKELLVVTDLYEKMDTWYEFLGFTEFPDKVGEIVKKEKEVEKILDSLEIIGKEDKVYGDIRNNLTLIKNGLRELDDKAGGKCLDLLKWADELKRIPAEDEGYYFKILGFKKKPKVAGAVAGNFSDQLTKLDKLKDVSYFKTVYYKPLKDALYEAREKLGGVWGAEDMELKG